MFKIETLFGAAFVVLLLALGAFVAFGGSGSDSRAAAPIGAEEAQKQALTDVCSCYELGFDEGAADADPLRTAYEAGYSSCRRIAGRKGGEAWSAGWTAAAEGKIAGRSCRRFAGF